MAIRVFQESGCFDPGSNIKLVNYNTNEENTFAKSIFRYPDSVTGINWFMRQWTAADYERWFTPVELDTCVTAGQQYFHCIMDTSQAQIQSQSGGVYGGTAIMPIVIPTCGIPQAVPERLIPSLATTPVGFFLESLGKKVYGSGAYGSYTISSVITCSTQSINSETGTVGGDLNPEFFVADTNGKHILIQYNSGSRKLTSGETITFTASEVTRVTATGAVSSMRWTPVFNLAYSNVSYSFTAQSVSNMDGMNMAHVKVGSTSAKFQPEVTITGPNNLSFKVKAGRNIQTRAAIYGRWEFDEKQVYWLQQKTIPIDQRSDEVIKKTNYQIAGGSGIDNSTIKEVDKASKQLSIESSGSTTSEESARHIKELYNIPNFDSSALKEGVDSSDLTKNKSNSYNINTNKDVTNALKTSQTVNTDTIKYEHFVEGVDLQSTKKIVHTNPTGDDSQTYETFNGKTQKSETVNKDAINSQKSLSLIGINSDVSKGAEVSIQQESNYQTKTNIKKSEFKKISEGNTETLKVTSNILVNMHDSANVAISDINSQNKNNPYNGGIGPDNNKVNEYGPVKSFDLLPKSTSTTKIQPYRYVADKRMNKTFNFSLKITMFSTPCGPCEPANDDDSCSPQFPTAASISLPFQKMFINNLTPEAERWSRICQNYNDNYPL